MAAIWGGTFDYDTGTATSYYWWPEDDTGTAIPDNARQIYLYATIIEPEPVVLIERGQFPKDIIKKIGVPIRNANQQMRNYQRRRI